MGRGESEGLGQGEGGWGGERVGLGEGEGRKGGIGAWGGEKEWD